MRFIDLNVDLGEGGSDDDELIALASSANIACGGHAGDESTMRAALKAASGAGVAAGAHPGYEDKEHFGRRFLELPPGDITELVARQLRRLTDVAAPLGVEIGHVKPHGALYLQADRDAAMAGAVVAGVTQWKAGCAFFAPPGGELAKAGKKAGLRVIAEGFVDRRYDACGHLLPRGQPGAVIEDVPAAVAQALEIAVRQRVVSVQGTILALPAATLCAHGDSSGAVALLRAVRSALEAEGIRIQRP